MSATTEKLDFLDHLYRAMVLGARCQQMAERESCRRTPDSARKAVQEVATALAPQLEMLKAEYERLGDLSLSQLPDNAAQVSRSVSQACAEMSSYLIYLEMPGMGLQTAKSPCDSVAGLLGLSREIH